MAIIDILGVPHTYQLTPPPRPNASVLVFVHGWLLSHRYWQPLVDRLSLEYQCLVYDLRGFGESQGHRGDLENSQRNERREPTQGYSLADYAKDLHLLMKKLKIDRSWLIGHSLGGSISIWAADLFPESIEGVICLNSGGGIYLKEEFERFRDRGQQIVKYRPQWLCQLPLLDLIFARTMVAKPLELHWGKQRLIDFVNAEYEAALGALMETTTESEVHLLPQVVSHLQQPIYFLAGAKDKVMEPKYVRHLASFHKLFQACGENVIEIPDCGHFSMVERPQEIYEIIRNILANNING